MRTQYTLLSIITAVLIGVFIYAYLVYLPGLRQELPPPARNTNISGYKKVSEGVVESIRRNNPEPLQEYFLEQVKKGDKSSLSKTAIYFITHRFFDNEGDMSEIITYIDEHPELSFLQKAETIYPQTFAKVKAGTGGTTDNLLAYLAYLEILDREGYADVATLATASAKYIELYHQRQRALSGTDPYAAGFIKKATYFADAAEPKITELIATNGIVAEEFSKDDVLVGMNQYGVTLAFFKKYSIPHKNAHSYIDVLRFANTYAREHNLMLKQFAALNFHYALFITGELSKEYAEEIRLGEILLRDYPKKQYSKGKFIDKIISGERIGFNKEGMYGKKFINSILPLDPTLKTYLLERGYTQ